ncbi:hypothetical protein [Dactylosporangium sp. NPDC005555]|uniref:hypothetical protein n=1 Tax=Dactylosporangium sp. NPDC005555 TaxID=3154889 RepID=UPI00339E4EC7
MSAEETLRAYAAGEDVTPTLLSAEGVIVTARRKVRNRRLRIVAAAGVATALVLVAVAVAAPDRHTQPAPPRPSPSAVRPTDPPLTCTAEPLPAPAGVDAARRVVTTIDPSGKYIVGRYSSGTNTSGLLLWTDGGLSRPAAARSFSPIAVNTRGVVAGTAPGSTGARQAAVYRDGKVSMLPTPAGTMFSAARGINAHGDIVGVVSGNDLPKLGGSTEDLPVLWPATGGFKLLESGRADWWQHEANAISDDGVIIGTVRIHRDVYVLSRPFRWNADGTGAMLPIPAPEENETTGATAMAGPWAIGPGGYDHTLSSSGPGLDPPAGYLRWNLVSGGFEKLDGFAPLTVSATGVMIGVGRDATGTPSVWRGGTVTPLPALDPARAPLLLSAGITADGATAVGTLMPPQLQTDLDLKGPYDMVRWTCPTTR